MDVMDVLRQTGGDADTTLRRFSGNEALLARFLKKFPQDTTFEQLETAVQEKNYKNALMMVHTLKGVSANLGFTDLYRHSSSMVDRLRDEEYDSALECFNAVKSAYQNVIETLKSLD